MHITIRFFARDDARLPCGAETVIGEELVMSNGRTWEDAEANLMARLSRLNVTPPDPKEVKI